MGARGDLSKLKAGIEYSVTTNNGYYDSTAYTNASVNVLGALYVYFLYQTGGMASIPFPAY